MLGSAEAKNKTRKLGANGKFWLPLTCSLPISRRRLTTPAHITIRWIVREPFHWIVREPCGPRVPPRLEPYTCGHICAAQICFVLTRKVRGRRKVRRPL